ncbi:cytochrome P450 [Kitasatospora sp. NPDC059811]|uniref:cytochrome P450 n=1 Tax=Streptomycetaceae TaxID=2062 RepID=UPI0007AF6ED2|nr:cytochrome P450 [Streptomyces sp. MJM8645]
MIPRPPGGLPLLGHLVPFLRDPLAFLRSLPRYGGLVQIRLGPVSAVVVCDLELTRHVLREDRVFDKGGFLFERVRDFAGNGLVTCPHADHRRQRRYVQPAFRADRIARYTEVMAREARRLAGSWSDGQEVDITAELSLAAGRSLVSTLFTRLPFTGLQETVDDFVLLIGGSYRRMLLPHRLNRIPLPANRRYDAARTRLVRLVDEVVTAYRADPEDRGDLVSTLVAADAGGQALSNAEVTDQVMTIFAAGFDTIANSTVWALHLLAQHPDIADRVRAEVDAARVDATGVNVAEADRAEADATTAAGTSASVAGTSASVDGLELTTRVVREAVRLYSPGWLLTRVTTTDTELGAHRLPEGTSVIYSPYLLHRQPALFPEPDRFDPERWVGVHPQRGPFIGFGAGPRRCVGEQFGMTESVLLLATIMRAWHLEHVPGRTVREMPLATLRPGPVWMRATRRDGLVRTGAAG